MGALSRVDNETEICSNCGSEEAILAMRGELTDWRVDETPMKCLVCESDPGDCDGTCDFCEEAATSWYQGQHWCGDCVEDDGATAAIFDAWSQQVMRKPDPSANCCFCDDVAFVWHLGLNLCMACDEQRHGDASAIRIAIAHLEAME
jgi:hypothetical protein